MFYLLCSAFCIFPLVCFLLRFSFSNFFLYYTIFHLQAFLPLYSLSCPFSSHLASFTSTLSPFPLLIFLSHLLFLLSVSPFLLYYSFLLFLSHLPFLLPISPFLFSYSFFLSCSSFPFSFSFLLSCSSFPFSFSFLLTYPYFIFSFFNLSFNSPSLSSYLIYLCSS